MIDTLFAKFFPYIMASLSLMAILIYIFLLIFKNRDFMVLGMDVHILFIAYFLMFILNMKVLLKKRRIPKEFQDF